MKIYKSQPKGKYGLVWYQMYGRSENQTTSDHPLSNVQSQSSISTTESNPKIKGALITTQKVSFCAFNSLCFKYFCVVVLHFYPNWYVKDLAMTSNHICG